MNDTHYYEVNLLWDFESRGTLGCPVTLEKTDAIPPSFPKVKKEKWTAEHLFVASVSSSLMSAFLLVAENLKLAFISFESSAIGAIEMIDGKLTVTEIVLKPTLVLASSQKESKAKRVLEMSGKACSISHAAGTKITIEQGIIMQ
jgi:organic hydroperoxide reductase OsmC/OhrA